MFIRSNRCNKILSLLSNRRTNNYFLMQKGDNTQFSKQSRNKGKLQHMMDENWKKCILVL